MALLISSNFKKVSYEKKNGEKITSFSQQAFDKYDALRSKRMVTRTSSCKLVFLYVKEVKKCDLMPFAAS